MLSDLLVMTSIQVLRVSETSDGMGGKTTSSSLTSLARGMIYQNSSHKSFLSDRVSAKSSDVLVTEPSLYSWTKDDVQVINGSKTYNVTSIPDDIMGKGEIMIVGLERVT